MTASTRLYASVAFAFGGEPAVRDLLGAGYDTIIVWTVHVHEDGSLFLNNTQIVSNGVYKEAEPMDLPSRLARLHKAGKKIIFSVGSGPSDKVHDFENIAKLLGGQPGGPGNVIYDNFMALKQAMVDAGGDIDAIDFDNEDWLFSDVMVNFGITLATHKSQPYAHVTFCPWTNEMIWFETMSGLVSKVGPDFVNAIHLQCYDGGKGNFDYLTNWIDGFKRTGGNAMMIAGLSTILPNPGPWWQKDNDDDPGRPGKNVVSAPQQRAGVSNTTDLLYMKNFATPTEALKNGKIASNFFIYCNKPAPKGDGSFYLPGDTLFYVGTPDWESDANWDGYYLAGECEDLYNPIGMGACPSDLQAKYQAYKSLLDGGFIWFYDSIISCLLSTNCCKDPTATAIAYRQAITNGLS